MMKLNELDLTKSKISKTLDYDGFPLVLVLFHLVNKCISIIKLQENRYYTKNKKKEIKAIKIYSQFFDKVCRNRFSNNVYHTINELFFHMVLIFIQIWKLGFPTME
jgi:hypothetical protein